METYCSKTKKGLQKSMMESKLSGGSGEDSEIFRMAIEIGSKHQIHLKKGNPNNADGNCLYESAIDNVNSRSCFTENLRESPMFYRRIWNQEGQEKIIHSDYYPYIYTPEQWEAAFEDLKNKNVYDIEYFGNLAILNIAHSLKKDILIINTPWKKTNASAHGPINEVYANGIDASNKKRTKTPIVLAYNGDHFESLIPSSDEDIEKTAQLVEAFKTGKYEIPESLKNLFNFNRILTQKRKKTEKTSSEENDSSDDFQNEKKSGSGWTKVKNSKKKFQPEENVTSNKVKITPRKVPT